MNMPSNINLIGGDKAIANIISVSGGNQSGVQINRQAR